MAETNPPQTKINVMLPVIVLDRGLKTCFSNWFVFHCKTNYVLWSSSSTCLRRGNDIGSGGSCLCPGSCVNIPVASLFMFRGEGTQTSTKSYILSECTFRFLPAPRHITYCSWKPTEAEWTLRAQLSNLSNTSLDVLHVKVFHLS